MDSRLEGGLTFTMEVFRRDGEDEKEALEGPREGKTGAEGGSEVRGFHGGGH